jgi:uridine phosphorylase
MYKRIIPESELVLNTQSNVYHLGVGVNNLSKKIILVGDQARVDKVAKHFSQIEFSHQNREFKTITGWYNNERISVISSGIGTDNIDILINEIDAAFNINLKTREIKEELTKLTFFRIGTTGSLQAHIPVHDTVFSAYSIGIDNVMHFYENFDKINQHELVKQFIQHCQFPSQKILPYGVKSNYAKQADFAQQFHFGITLTSSGFYAPQGRSLRLLAAYQEINQKADSFEFDDFKMTNYEMETSALYGLSSLMGHEAATTCLVIANRKRNEFSKNYETAMNTLIEKVLGYLTN